MDLESEIKLFIIIIIINNLQKKFNNCFSGDFNGHFKVILVQIPGSRYFVDFSHCYCCMTAPMRSLKWRYYLFYVIFIKIC